jgi:hypothetical protein
MGLPREVKLSYSKFRIILLLIIKMKLEAWSLDVETAFLHGDLDECISMKIPDGSEMK